MIYLPCMKRVSLILISERRDRQNDCGVRPGHALNSWALGGLSLLQGYELVIGRAGTTVYLQNEDDGNTVPWAVGVTIWDHFVRYTQKVNGFIHFFNVLHFPWAFISCLGLLCIKFLVYVHKCLFIPCNWNHLVYLGIIRSKLALMVMENSGILVFSDIKEIWPVL